MRVPGHVRPLLAKHVACHSPHRGNGHPQRRPKAASNKSCDIGARQGRKSEGLAAGSRAESSPFLRHFRLPAAKRLKVRHPFKTPERDVDLPEQPSRQRTR
jgi:hypothetical protein